MKMDLSKTPGRKEDKVFLYKAAHNNCTGLHTLDCLSSFLEAVSHDPRISSTHIGVYAALLHFRNKYCLDDPIKVFSHQIMPLARISSAATYFKCVKALDEYGYLRYEPSYKNKEGSKIYFASSNIRLM